MSVQDLFKSIKSRASSWWYMIYGVHGKKRAEGSIHTQSTLWIVHIEENELTLTTRSYLTECKPDSKIVEST